MRVPSFDFFRNFNFTDTSSLNIYSSLLVSQIKLSEVILLARFVHPTSQCFVADIAFKCCANRWPHWCGEMCTVWR